MRSVGRALISEKCNTFVAKVEKRHPQMFSKITDMFLNKTLGTLTIRIIMTPTKTLFDICICFMTVVFCNDYRLF